MTQQIIDTHVHFWNPEHLRYPWLEANEKLNRPFLPPDYTAAIGEINVEKIVFVQADAAPDDGLDEAEWVASLAEADKRIQGIVAFAPLEKGDGAEAYLQELASHEIVKGVRRLIQSEPLGFATQPDFVRGVQLLSQYGLSFDICIYHPQLGDTIELVRQCPDVAFVLDHVGKPGIKDGLLDPWREQITALAGFENVMCKISGMVTEADHRSWSPDDLKPYIEHVIASFGIERVMYGSDWPVMTLASSYTRWIEVLNWATQGFSEQERSRLFYDNALVFYRLG